MPHPHSPAAVADTHGRYDMYGLIHKALRRAQCDMLIRLGSTDFSRRGLDGLIDDLRGLLSLGASHISHEEVHIHTALDLRAPKATDAVQHEHDSHRQSFRQLEELIDRLENAEASRRPAIGRQLYLSYSLFVARDFEHMFEEETELSARLWDHFDDAELGAMEGAIKSSLPPEKVIVFMRLMIPAINAEERAGMLGGMKAHAPREAFEAVMELAARPTLSPEEMGELERRLALSQCVPA